MEFIRKYASALGWALVALALVLAVVGLVRYGKRLESQKQAVAGLQKQVQVQQAESTRLSKLRAAENAEAKAQNESMQQYQKEAQKAHDEAQQYRDALRSANRVRWSPSAVQSGPREAVAADPGRPEAAGGTDVPPAFAARVADLLTEADALALRYNQLLRVAESHTCESPK